MDKTNSSGGPELSGSYGGKVQCPVCKLWVTSIDGHASYCAGVDRSQTARPPMTGDGAVVRPPVDEAFTDYLAKLQTTAATGCGSWKKGANDALGNVVTVWDAVVRPHILAQAAEIERLNKEWDLLNVEKIRAERRAIASEARAAALEPYEKLALQLTDACVRWGWGHCTAGPELIAQIDDVIARFKASEARTADLLKALEEYGKHHGVCPHSADPFTSQECRCGLVETLAAAKGETI